MILASAALVTAYTALASYLWHSLSFGGSALQQQQQQNQHGVGSLSMWITTQYHLSVARMLSNVAPFDVDAGGAAAIPGAVRAAKSAADPPYAYHWVRDGALVMRTVTSIYRDLPARSPERDDLEEALFNFVRFNSHLQSVPTMSNSTWDPVGITEPKYNLDGTAFTGPWCRPQDDGIALRISFVRDFVEAYMSQSSSSIENGSSHLDTVKSLLFDPDFQSSVGNGSNVTKPLANVDLLVLEKIAYQNRTCDLWEEVRGLHYYTVYSQYKAFADAVWLYQKVSDLKRTAEGGGRASNPAAATAASSFNFKNAVKPPPLQKKIGGQSSSIILEASIEQKNSKTVIIIDDTIKRYKALAEKGRLLLLDFWDDRPEYQGGQKLNATVQRVDLGTTANHKDSNLDISCLLAHLHACVGQLHTDKSFCTASEADNNNHHRHHQQQHLHQTVVKLRQAFVPIYEINTRCESDPKCAQTIAPAIGRYPEDQYYGGNPWFLSTLALAEYNYARARAETNALLARFTGPGGVNLKFNSGVENIHNEVGFKNNKRRLRTGSGLKNYNALDSQSRKHALAFFKRSENDQMILRALRQSREAKKNLGGSATQTSGMLESFENTIADIQELIEEADRFLRRVQKHAPKNSDPEMLGQLDEQFDRNTGFMTSAKDLTWSHAAFITAVRQRNAALNDLQKLQNQMSPTFYAKKPKSSTLLSEIAKIFKGIFFHATSLKNIHISTVIKVENSEPTED